MSSNTRLTYNIIDSKDIDQNKNYYTSNEYNPYNNNLNSFQNPNFAQNESLLKQKSNNNIYDENRFSRLHSKIDEINEKLNKEKIEKENLIHSKISTAEMFLNNNNEIKSKKIKEIKSSIKNLSLLLEQIKNNTDKQNEESNNILEEFENKFYIRLKEEEQKRINLEKNLKTIIDIKFKDMKNKINSISKEMPEKLEILRNNIDTEIPQLQNKINISKKERIEKDEEIKEEIRKKMNFYNEIMKKEIKNRENFDETALENVKLNFSDFNKVMRQNTLDREQNQDQLLHLVETTTDQLESKSKNNNDINI